MELELLTKKITDAVTAAGGKTAPVVVVVVNDNAPQPVTEGRLLNATQLAAYLNLTPEYLKNLSFPLTCPAGFDTDGKPRGRIYYDIDAVNQHLAEKTIKPGKTTPHRPGVNRKVVNDLKKRLHKSIARQTGKNKSKRRAS